MLFSFLIISLACLGQDWKASNDQGMLHYKKGEYKKAEQFFLSALDASLKLYGELSYEYITSITNLAYAQQMGADYLGAQQNFRKALACYQTMYHSLHIDQIEATLNLANAFLPSAQYDSCERYLLIARELVTQATQERSEHYIAAIHRFFDASINVQNSLASLFYKKGQVAEAITLMTQQRKNIRQAYPQDYRSLAIYQNTVNNLSTYLMEGGQAIQAKTIVQEQVSLASENPAKLLDHLYALNNLGNVYRMAEQPDSAEYTWIRAASIIKNSGQYYGSDLHIAVLNNLGELRLSHDQYDGAFDALKQSIALQESRAALNPRLYQTTLLNLCETYRWSGNLVKADENYKKLTDMLLEEILHNFTYLSDKEKISFYRSNLSILEYYTSFAFEASGTFKRKEDDRYVSKDAMKNLFDLLLITKGLILHPGYRLKNSILTGADPLLRSNYQLWEKSKYEYANLARSESPDRARVTLLAQEIESLEKWLRSYSAEFRKGFVIEKKTWQDIQKTLLPDEAVVEMVRLADGLVYGALILTSTTTDGPVVALIKSTTTLHLERQFYKQYSNSILYTLPDTTSYDVYWKPILEAIRNHTAKGSAIEHIFLSPDGIYNQVSLMTLYNPETKRYLIDETDIRLVTNMKDILSGNDVRMKKHPDAVLIGRPAFSMQKENDTEVFSDLIGTEKEIDEINKLLLHSGWKTVLLKHGDAQEASVKSLDNPEVLHIATHGFSAHNTGESDLVNTLLNSGIVLAGAGDKGLLQGEDGILTAYEMMNIHLDSTSLVVLSACETGLGEFHTGEGIYGLQAALRSAGARSVIMSLWKVDDTATQQLMTGFYRHWLRHPEDMRAAFREAQQELRETFPSPYYWGAFVLTGK